MDHRDGRLLEHELRTLVGQRVLGIALGYEDLNDHDQLRHDPMMAVLAGKSTPNRLELSGPRPGLYHKIGHWPAAVEALFVQQFVAAHRTPPAQIVLGLDATVDPCMGIRRSASSTSTTTLGATCRCTSSAAGIW